MEEDMKYHFLVHNDPDGVWGECLELPGCMVEEDEPGDFVKQTTEVLNLYLDEPKDSEIIFPLPYKDCNIEYVIEVKVYDHIAMNLIKRQEKLEIIKIKEKYESLIAEIKKDK